MLDVGQETTFVYIGAGLQVHDLPKMCEIPAGTFFLIPHIDELNDIDPGALPFGSVVLAGQRLLREMYPEISSIFSATGGFYEFELPNLLGKFMLGFDDDGNMLKASGAMFYMTVPPKLIAPRDIR